jgi:hypothetical protein
MTLNGCTECLKQPREIDRLTEALQRLRQKLRDQARQATEGFFGSQSDAGAHTRVILMSVLHTLNKRHMDVVAQLKRILDQLAFNLYQDPFPLLFPEGPT